MHIAKSRLLDANDFKSALNRSAEPIAVFREQLQRGRDTLEQYHLDGALAQEVVYHHAWLVDQFVCAAWQYCAGNTDPDTGIALVAVGGYGRGELHPHSDVDLMLLLRARAAPELREFAERFLRFLWDIGLDVGHSVRTVADSTREAKRDITIATNIMESRHLAGDKTLTEAMQVRTAAPRVWPARRFFEAKWDEQIARHARFDDTAYNLEPNLKEGPGGLRDIHMIGWVARRYFGGTELKDLVAHGFLTEDEHRTLIRGRNFLWRLRIGLHLLAKRREDRLLFDHQRTLAQQFGYRDRSNNLAVEQLMKRYYRTVKELRLLNEILLQHFQEAILSRRRVHRNDINRRFWTVDGFLEASDAKVFERAPFALLETFLILQQHEEIKGVRASTIRLIRENLHRIDPEFRRDIRCRTLFMEILRQPHGVTRALRRMNGYGVLGAYIPIFGRIVGQMQHDLFHVFTVDAHSLFVVRNLRRFAVDRFEHEYPHASEIMARLFKRERLYLAGLFHDVAKGQGGDHSVLGEKQAFEFCKAHDLSDYDAHFVAWLVRHHLLLSWTAQREDISDQAVIARFVQIVGDQKHLDNLYLLTMADIRGTSPHVWNTWKGRLLSDLYGAASRALRHGLANPAQLDDRIRELKHDALGCLAGLQVDENNAKRYWDYLDPEYFLRHDAETVAWHTDRIVNARLVDLPLVAARYHPVIGAAQFLIFASESDTLLPSAAGGFDRQNLNIVDARIHSAKAGLALLVFVVLGRRGENLEDPEQLHQHEQILRRQLLEPEPLGRAASTVTLPRTLKHFPIDTRVTFSDPADTRYTTMEVVAQDRPGLLFHVSKALLHCKVRLLSAKITTFGERAEDVFFIVDRDGELVNTANQRECLTASIHAALDSTPIAATASA